MKRKSQNTLGALIDVLGQDKFDIKNVDDNVDIVKIALSKLAKEPHRTHGFRIESMFAYVAGALGRCALIKQEDGSGVCFVQDENIGVPDYKIVLDDSQMFFVEVKNCARKKLLFKKNTSTN